MINEYFADGYLVYTNGAWRDASGDVVEIIRVRHGTWRLETDDEMLDYMFKLVACSECREKTSQTYPFCPYCGAKMTKFT